MSGTFCATFGSRYSREEHPHLPAWACNPNGWLEILAEDETQAWELARHFIGCQPGTRTVLCAFIYTPETWEAEWFRDGCSGRITSDGLTRTKAGVA